MDVYTFFGLCLYVLPDPLLYLCCHVVIGHI